MGYPKGKLISAQESNKLVEETNLLLHSVYYALNIRIIMYTISYTIHKYIITYQEIEFANLLDYPILLSFLSLDKILNFKLT